MGACIAYRCFHRRQIGKEPKEEEFHSQQAPYTCSGYEVILLRQPSTIMILSLWPSAKQYTHGLILWINGVTPSQDCIGEEECAAEEETRITSMLPSVLAFSATRKPRPQPAKHNIACGLLDVLACKHCRRSRSRYKEGDKLSPNKKKAQKEQQNEQIFGKYLTPSGNSRNATLALSRRHSLSTSDLPNASRSTSEGILKPSPSSEHQRRLPSDSNLKKQARFSESVSVIVHDLDGHQLMKDHIQLKKSDSPTDETAPICANMVDPKKYTERPFRLERMEIEKRSGVNFLKVVVHLGLEYMNDRVEIHSGKLGQSFVVVAFKPEPLGDGTDYHKRYMQRFRLTESVNPFAIEATLLSKGYVKIRAPLAPLDE
ncbi:hypothetical protein CAPTEDRAFT_220517 [Capitella teleta]|uniref:SHSP domain-containing protein n=1 Tax=Capitella teleta TaxID=283909 RepID=R7TH27_CAPTE|nr:hypothetical protein CAPTEDRAFT_220517 [Capitella teleta]|eukprot:ELT93009.1 hypothetical protein CAPTEDRAFT_220517 [Capitella teleta]